MNKTRRNDPCPCGSGKKYKHCCLPGETLDTSLQPLPSARNSKQTEAFTSSQMNEVVTLFAAGRHADVERLARSLLDRHPNSGLAWKFLGTALQMQGKDGLQRSMNWLRIWSPDDAEQHSNLGIVLRNRGQLEDAVKSCRRALRINPEYADARTAIWALLCTDSGNWTPPWQSYRRALQIKPKYAEMLNNLGMALSEIGQLDEAVTYYRKAVNIKPDYAEAFSNLGNALRANGQHVEAQESYREALKIKPHFSEAHNNLGNALREAGHYDNAISSYRQAIGINPGYAESL